MTVATSISQMHAVPARARRTAHTNIGAAERWLSSIGGALLVVYGVRNFRAGGFLLAALGGALLERGVSGHCGIYEKLGVSTRHDPEHPERSLEGAGKRLTRVERTITVARPVAEVYRFVRDVHNAPRYMAHLASVEEIGAKRLRVTGRDAEGHAAEIEVIEEREDEAIVLRHGEATAGQITVLFAKAPGERGTEIRVMIDLGMDGPEALLRRALLTLTGDDPDRVLQFDLRRLKMLLEAGEVITVEGQTSGRESDRHGKGGRA